MKAEIIDLFAAKLLNFIRNPFCIEKVLNSFPGVASYDPTDPALLADYRRIVSGKKPHQAHLCTEARDQRRTVCRMVAPAVHAAGADGRPNFFEEMIKGLIENRKMHVAAFVCEYDNARRLLSDRGFSQPIEDGPHMAFSFNLCATASWTSSSPIPTLVRGNASPEFIAQAIASWERLPEKQIHVTFLRNNLDILARYNRRVVEQCRERVYCSAKDGLILSKPGPLGEPVALP